MQKHSFTVTIPAYNRAEAESKLELLMQLGAFLSDFNVTDLVSSLLKIPVTALRSPTGR